MFMLWRATGFRRALEVWLGVALLALLLDNSITMAGGSRLSVGWYVGRINALISAVVMLAIYLKEINTGYLASMQNAKQLARYQSDLEDIVAERTQVLEDTKAALLHSQKLEAVGKLTGGVAHDFNNVLHIINGNIELIKHISNGNEQISARLAPVRAAVERGAKLSSQLLAFARKQPLQPTTVNVCEILLDMDLLLKRAVGERISIENIHCDDAWKTLADPHQLENVILNLALNASDAILDRGQVTFEVANAVLTDADIKGRQELNCGEYVKLVIRDTGCGMTPEVKGRAFEPFFTTKEVGKGTGLGLSMAYGFVKQSGGHIEIDSELGRGTSITIYLPRSLQSQKIKPALEVVQATGGNECILIVEDDRDVQSAVVGMLERLGYQTVTADSPDEAVALLGTTPKIDLLFTDVVMPGKMSSTEFARYAIDKYPNLGVVFTSGYTRDVMVQDGGFLAGVQLLSNTNPRLS